MAVEPTMAAPLPTGGTVSLKVPAGTASGKKIRIPGKGVPASASGGAAGDLYVVIQIVPPKDPNELTKQLLAEVGRAIENPRARAPWASASRCSSSRRTPPPRPGCCWAATPARADRCWWPR